MGRWAHVVCCLFLPEVHFVDHVTMSEAVVPKDEGFQMLYQKTCSICDKVSTDNTVIEGEEGPNH